MHEHDARQAHDDAELERIVAARRARRRRRRPMPRRRALLLGILCLVVVATGALAGAGLTGRALLLDSCRLEALRPIALGQNSFLFASDGTLLGVVPSSRNRQPLRLASMSRWLPLATVAVEDRRFYRHGALDYRAILRALLADLHAGRIVQGGSTLTQELVRNLYIGESPRTLSRKLKEACLAEKVARIWTKREILAAYLNEVYYGRHAYGAEAGAQTFFSRDAGALTLPQAALLAGLPQAPSIYDPVAHPRAALRRRNDVLRALLAQRDISAARYRAARSSPLGLHPGRLYSSVRHPNFFGWAQQQLVGRFGAQGVEGGGLQVRTTLDLRMQAAARAAVAGVLRERTDPAAALVAIEPGTGAVRAMISYVPGGRPLQFNLATQGHRQAGSAFKPFVLATAVQEGVSVYSGFAGPPYLTVTDPRCSTNGQLWEVHNYADETAGYMNLLDATAHSVNTIFAQLVDVIGPEKVVPVAHRMGIASPLHPVCSITLGTQAVTPLEMTDGYATLAARGLHHAPQAFERVRGPGGEVVGRLPAAGRPAISQNAADLVTYALEGVVQHGTGTAAGFGRPAAGKTGTAESFQDAWFCGYVPQLAACVWIGYPKGEIPLENVEGVGAVFGGSLPAEIWRRFMSVAVARLPAEQFAYPVFGGRAIGSSGYYAPAPVSPAPPAATTRVTTPAPPPPTPKPKLRPAPVAPTAPTAPATTAPAATTPPPPPPTTTAAP